MTYFWVLSQEAKLVKQVLKKHFFALFAMFRFFLSVWLKSPFRVSVSWQEEIKHTL